MVKHSKEIFCFGANEAGRHSKGSALHAVKYHGAKYGQGYGIQGNSFGIPTKDKNLKVLSLIKIKEYVDMFLDYAKQHKEYKFNVVKIGCGLAGYKDSEIAPMFRNKPDNVFLDVSWDQYMIPKGEKHELGIEGSNPANISNSTCIFFQCENDSSE